MPKADTSSITSRRALLAGAASTPVLALPALAAVAAEQPVDPHPAWLAEWRALIEWQDTTRTGGRDLEQFWQYHRTLELEGMIGAAPSRTLAGGGESRRGPDPPLRARALP